MPEEPEEEVVEDETEVEEEEDEPDEAVTAHAEKLLAKRATAMEQKLAAFGLSLSEEGEPVISDPRRLREWMGPLEEKDAPAPTPAPAPPAAEEPEWDVLELTPEKLQRMIRAEAEKIARPLQERLVQQQSLIGRRWVDEAMQQTESALATYAPDYAHIVDHPQFEALYRGQLEKLPPEYLENPQALASTALSLIAFLDGKQMPQRRSGTAAAARGMVNRMSVPASMPSGESAAALTRGSREWDSAAQFLADAGVVSTSAEELEALDAVDKWGFHTVKAYQDALEKKKSRKGRR